MTNEMYPSLSQLLPLDKIPNELEGIKDAIGAIFDELYVKNLIANQSPDGSAGFYSFNLTTNDSIGLNIPIADDLRLVLNPTNVGTTEIPVSFDYSWIILKYIKDFNHQSFDNSIASILNILFDLAGLDQKTFLSDIVNTFYIGPTGLNDFVNDFNGSNPDALEIPSDSTFTQDDQIESLVGQISKRDLNLMQFTYETNIDVDNEGLERLKKLFRRYFDNIEESLKEAIKLNFNVSINKVSVGLQFPQKWLIPVDAQNEPLPDTFFSYLTFDVGSLFYSSEGGFKFNNISAFNLTKSMIGNTGLIAEFSGLKVDLNKDRNIPEAIADGRPMNFMGVYAQYASVTLPKKWFKNEDNPDTTLKLAAYNSLVGSGGVSGTIALEAIDTANTIGEADFLWKQFGSGATGFKVGFNKFEMTFKQNAVVSSNIQALLEINRFKYPQGHPNAGDIIQIGVKGHLQDDGDFNLTASVDGGIKASLGKFVDFNFLTLELGKEDDNFYIGTSVEVTFPNGIMNTITNGKKIILPKIRVYSDGSFEIVGGNGFLPVNFNLPLGPVDLSVTGIHIGSIQKEFGGVTRKYNYIGFDGAININPFGIDARGEGIKYYYTTDDEHYDDKGDAYLHIQTLYIDIVLPYNSPAVTINGMLSIPEPGVSEEYQGSVGFKIHSTGLAGKADMRLNPSYPAFLVDASVNLPTPIPLGAVSIYGFRGLIGHRYVAEKKGANLPDTATWYDYYKVPPKGIHVSKFSGPEETVAYNDPFSLGAGVVLGTSFDNGNVLGIRAILLLSIPSSFMIQGSASVLAGRPGLIDPSEPPFFAMVAFGSTSVEMNFGANYKLTKSGDILQMNVEVQAAFFRNNPSNWYVNFGTKQKPNSAVLFKKLVKLEVMAYLMLSSKGIEAGARLDYEIKKNFFGIKVHLYAYVEVGANISFERPQLGGYISLGGGIKVNVWRMISLRFELNAILAAEASRPFLIFAQLKFKGRIKVGFIKIGFRVTLKLKWEGNSIVDFTPIPALPYQNTNTPNGLSSMRVEELVKGVHMLTNESFNIKYLGVDLNGIDVNKIDTFIPLDTYIDIKTVKGLDPTAVGLLIGGHTTGATDFIDLIPPQKTIRGGKTLRQVKHKYSIESLEIFTLVAGSWKIYHPYAAVVPEDDQPLVQNFKIGYWQRSGNQYSAIRLLATNPLSYLDAGEPGWFIPEQNGVTAGTMFCHTAMDKWKTSNVLNKPLNTTYQLPLQFDAHYINGAYYTLHGDYDVEFPDNEGVSMDSMKVTNVANPHGFAKSLTISNYNSLVLVFPEDTKEVELILTTQSQTVKFTFYRAVTIENSLTVSYVEVLSQIKTSSQLNSILAFSFALETPINKVVIEPIFPNYQEILTLNEQIQSLFTDTYEEASGMVNVTLPSNYELYIQLMQQLEALIANGCAMDGNPCADKDQLLCDFYLSLLNMNCFGPVDNYEDLKNYCYKNIHAAVREFLYSHPNYIPILQPLMTAYNIYMDIYQSYEYSEEEVLESYYTFWQEVKVIFSNMLVVGKCDCANVTSANCTTSFQQVRWKTVVDFEFESTVPGADAVQENLGLMQSAISRNPQPVWRPNGTYYIKFSLKDDVQNGNPNSKTFNYYYGFKTGGPVGYFHNTPGVTYGNEYDQNKNLLNRKDNLGNISANGSLTNPDKYPLTSLRSYIDYQRSYPNADGNLIMAKPAYYSAKECRIAVYFTKSYVFNLMNNWPKYGLLAPLKCALNIMIKDPVSNELIPYPLPIGYDPVEMPPLPLEDVPSWEPDSLPVTTIGISILNNFLNNGEMECEVQPGTQLEPASFNYNIVLTHLKPQKLYTALLFNAFDVDGNGTIESSEANDENKEVHRFVFQTSRYGTFQEHIQSYIMQHETDTKPSLFTINELLSVQQIRDAFLIVSGNGGNIENTSDYADPFDRVIDDILKMKPQEAPLNTEFNLIINSNQLIAIIVRSPEPFNNPRMPSSVIAETIKVVLPGTYEPRPEFSVLHSKDCSQCIIMAGDFIADTELCIMFDYITWDGVSYTRPENVGTAEYVDLNLLNL